LNVLDFDAAERDPAAEALLRERDKARADRNWPVADRIREKLIEMGVSVQDEKFGKT
jgi:cysteinyl-tRNA synthetase